MPIPKKYFQDRLIVLLFGVSAFLATVGSLLIILRIDTTRTTGYYIEYRANYGVGDFKPSGAVAMLQFVVFFLINIIMAILLSMRMYNLRRHVALLILSLSILLSLLAIIVSNALLVLR